MRFTIMCKQVKDLRKMFEEAWDKPILPITNLEFESPASSCLKSRLEKPNFPAGLGVTGPMHG